MNLSLFIARRLYRKNGKKRASLPAIRIATLGVSVGLAVMILAVAIIRGFKNEISSKVVGFGSHITIYNSGVSDTGDPTTIKTDKTFINTLQNVRDVKHVQRFSMKTGLFKTAEQFAGITLKGVGSDYDTTFIAAHIKEGVFPNFSDTKSANKVVISKKVATDLNLKAGDKIFAYFFDNGLRARRFEVAAIYSTDMLQFDKVFAFASESAVKKLCKQDSVHASGLEIAVKDFAHLENASRNVAKLVSQHNLAENTSYVSYTIKELYPQIFDWLDLLDVNIMVILVLMLAVAGVTIVSGLLILILERTSTIALLKTLGASNILIRKVFINLTIIILIKGMLLGNVIGLSIAFIQYRFHVFHFPNPEDYYLDSIPVDFDMPVILMINAVTFVVSTLALVVPSCMVARIHPSKVLRFE